MSNGQYLSGVFGHRALVISMWTTLDAADDVQNPLERRCTSLSLSKTLPRQYSRKSQSSAHRWDELSPTTPTPVGRYWAHLCRAPHPSVYGGGRLSAELKPETNAPSSETSLALDHHGHSPLFIPFSSDQVTTSRRFPKEDFVYHTKNKRISWGPRRTTEILRTCSLAHASLSVQLPPS